jgi:hypothetical protein
MLAGCTTLPLSPTTAAGQASLIFRVAMPVAIEPFEHVVPFDHESEGSEALAFPRWRLMQDATLQANQSHLRVEQARA